MVTPQLMTMNEATWMPWHAASRDPRPEVRERNAEKFKSFQKNTPSRPLCEVAKINILPHLERFWTYQNSNLSVPTTPGACWVRLLYATNLPSRINDSVSALTKSCSVDGPATWGPAAKPPIKNILEIISSTSSPASCKAGLSCVARRPASTSSWYVASLTVRPLKALSDAVTAFRCSAVSLRGNLSL